MRDDGSREESLFDGRLFGSVSVSSRLFPTLSRFRLTETFVEYSIHTSSLQNSSTNLFYLVL